MMMDPLTGAVCNPPEIWQMVDEFLVAQAGWLPQYTEAVAEAKERLKDGLSIPVDEGYRGAARKEVKSVEQMQADAEAARENAAAADKAQAQRARDARPEH
jgi:alpha-galactosidase